MPSTLRCLIIDRLLRNDTLVDGVECVPALGVSHSVKNFHQGSSQINGTSPITMKKSFQLYRAKK